jgi:hypothetical protein
MRYLSLRNSILTVCCLLVASVVHAAPRQVELVYEATRNGQPFATVTETFRQENGRYRIESVTQGVGVYALFGKRRLLSEGEVTEQGLKPSHFELHQGDNDKKSLLTDFDWPQNQLNMQVKGKTVTAALEPGTQDLASFIYQFMFRPPVGEDVNMPVTTGKKLRSYHYRVTERDVTLDLPGGHFKTLHLVDATPEGEDSKEFWLATDRHHLPVRLEMRDDKGAKIEQILTSVHAE